MRNGWLWEKREEKPGLQCLAHLAVCQDGNEADFVSGLSGVDFIGIKGPSSQCSLQKYQENDQLLILEP